MYNIYHTPTTNNINSLHLHRVYYNVGHSPLQTVIVEVLSGPSSGLHCTVGDQVIFAKSTSLAHSPQVTLQAADL